MPNTNPWDDYIKKSTEEFAETAMAKESKENIYYAVMSQITDPTQNIVPYSSAVSQVEELSKKKSILPEPAEVFENEDTKKTGYKPPIKLDFSKLKKITNLPVKLGGAVAAAAAFVLLMVNLNAPPSPALSNDMSFNPPLTLDDMPVSMIDPNQNYRTVATSNQFYLGYNDNPAQQESVKFLIHSRADKVDWSRLFIVDEDNDIITPIEIDQEAGTVTIPICELDVTLEIADNKGNRFECTLPAQFNAF